MTDVQSGRLGFSYGDLEVADPTLIRLNVYGNDWVQWSLLLFTKKVSLGNVTASELVFICSTDNTFTMYQADTQTPVLQFVVDSDDTTATT